MKLLISFAAVAAIVAYALPVYEDADTEWFKFKATYGKVYKNIIEENQRRALFASNLKFIKDHNELYKKGESTYFLKVNRLADWKDEERAALNGFKKSKLANIDVDYFKPDPNATVPDSFDWRTLGAVTRVKNQAQCGSCWAFSTTGSLEAAYFFKTGILQEISEQNLIDCATNPGLYGCGGGDMPPAFTYIYKNDGINSEESYPYEGVNGQCRYDVASNITSVRGYGYVREYAEDDLKAAVAALGPISIAIDAKHKSFQFYGGGVYYEKDCKYSIWQTNHAVLAIGQKTMKTTGWSKTHGARTMDYKVTSKWREIKTTTVG